MALLYYHILFTFCYINCSQYCAHCKSRRSSRGSTFLVQASSEVGKKFGERSEWESERSDSASEAPDRSRFVSLALDYTRLSRPKPNRVGFYARLKGAGPGGLLAPRSSRSLFLSRDFLLRRARRTTERWTARSML